MNTNHNIIRFQIILFSLFLLLVSGCVANKVKPELPVSELALRMYEVPQPDITFERMLEMERDEAGAYQLGPGDTITVYVYGEESLTRSVTIEPNGHFTFPLIGEVRAKNRTIGEIVAELDERLNQYLKGAKSDIIINEFSSNQFVVLGGGLKTSGLYTITGEMRLLDAIATAGGLRAVEVNMMEVPGADLQRSYLSRGSHILPIDFGALINEGDMRYNIRIRPKDVIYVPLLTSNEVLILGQVNKPSVIPMIGMMTITKAITLGGDFSPNARSSHVNVIRNATTKPERFVVDVEDILDGKAVDFVLQPNDIIFVPASIL